MKQFRCPDGLPIWNTPKSGDWTTFIYREIFEDRCYEQHGVTIGDGSVILDVGANVGLFALSLTDRFRNLKIICIEPVPAIRACLERNLNDLGAHKNNEITVLATAIGAEPGEATITYFPQAPGSSTLHPEAKKREWNSLADQLTSTEIGEYNKLYAWVPPRIVGWFMKLKIKEAVSFNCEVRTLSQIIREQGLQRIDLLKIDIEGCELEALKGIEDCHWPLIQQLVMEIDDENKGELDKLTERLRGLGFTKITAKGAHGDFVGCARPCTFYAIRAPGES